MLFTSLSVTPRLYELLEKSSDIPLQLSTPIEKATGDEKGWVSRAYAESFFRTLEQVTLTIQERTRNWYELVQVISSADNLDETEDALRFGVSLMQQEAKKMSSMLALLHVAYLKTELSSRWKPYQAELRELGRKSIRAATEMRNAHISMEKALTQWLPHPINDQPIPLAEEQSRKIVDHSHKAWGIAPHKWGVSP